MIVRSGSPQDYINAARVPRMIMPQEFGLWTIQRLIAGGQIISETERALHVERCGFPDYTLLRRMTEATMHCGGDIVMEDSAYELRKHLPIWLAARGRVLVTGLGLGCVVRGLLANRDVDQIDVVEIDDDILRVIGPEFARDPRVTLHHGDALTIDIQGRWDCAWHDLWTEDGRLQRLHIRLFMRFRDRCGPQGAWALPRFAARLIQRTGRFQLLGAPRYA